jgi:hypothetical protein
VVALPALAAVCCALELCGVSESRRENGGRRRWWQGSKSVSGPLYLPEEHCRNLSNSFLVDYVIEIGLNLEYCSYII